MGVTSSSLVQVQPPEGHGDEHILASKIGTSAKGDIQTSATDFIETNGNCVSLSEQAIEIPSNRVYGSAVRIFKRGNTLGLDNEPILEIPNQRARVHRSLLGINTKSNEQLTGTEENELEDNGETEQLVYDDVTDNSNDLGENVGIYDEDQEINLLSDVPIIYKALYDGQLNVKQDEDNARCDITGCDVFGLNGDKIAIADNWNGCVKVFLVKDRSFLAGIQLEIKPWDITNICPMQLVATCNNTLAVLNFSQEHGTIVLDRVIPVQGRSRGIVFSNTTNTFIVTFVQPEPSTKIIQPNGNVLKVIHINASGFQLFKRPEYVTTDAKSSFIYVSDFQLNSITCLTPEGEVHSVYLDPDLKKPTGVAMDNSGCLIVAGWGSENVVRVSKICERIQTVLESRDIITYPQALAYFNETLHISHYHFTSINNYLSTYRLTHSQDEEANLINSLTTVSN